MKKEEGMMDVSCSRATCPAPRVPAARVPAVLRVPAVPCACSGNVSLGHDIMAAHSRRVAELTRDLIETVTGFEVNRKRCTSGGGGC